MSDGEGGGGPTVIRSDRRSLGKRLANKQAAVAAAAASAAGVPASSSSPVQLANRTESPSAHSPVSLPPVSEDSESEKPIVKCESFKLIF